MRDENKTKARLIDELNNFRRSYSDLEAIHQQMMERMRGYRDFMENIDDLCFETDLRGNTTYCNERFVRLLGYTIAEFQQLTLRERHGSDAEAKKNAEKFTFVYQMGKAGERYDTVLCHRDGTLVNVEVSVSLTHDEKGNPAGFRGIARDVTERKKNERVLQRYRDFVENVEDACYETDLDGRYIFVNDTACRRSGYTREEILQGAWTLQSHTESEEANRKAVQTYREVARTGVPAKMIVHDLLRKDGTRYSAEVSISPIRDAEGKTTGFRIISRDVTDRMKLERDLERYKEFVENVDDGCFEVDLNGRYLIVNDAMCRRSGYTREEMLAIDPTTLYANNEDRRRVRRVFVELYNTGVPQNIAYPYIRKDGTVRHVENSLTLMRNAKDEPVGFRVISRDITERLQMEREQERYRNFLENIDEICWENDLKGRLTFGNEKALKRFRFDSDPALKQYGSTKEEQLKAKVSYRKYLRPENIERYNKVYSDVYTSGKSKILYNVPVSRPDGGHDYHDLTISLIRDEEGKPTGFRTIARDITERHKMEQEQERYRNFLDNIDEYCFESDLNGNLIFANEKALKMFGLTREQVQQGEINYRTALAPQRAEKYYQIFLNVYQTGNPAVLYDFEVTLPGGERRYLDMGMSLIRSEEGKTAGFRMIARNVTQRKLMEDEQEKLKEKLIQSEKLESIGTLAGGIAHDFNNLLMGIQGYTSLMLMDIDAAHPFYERLKMIESQVKSGADLTKQLLGYARGGRYEMKVTDINDLIKKTAFMFGRTKKDIRIHQNYADGLWNIEADEGQMEQVLLNLFLNASEAMPGGGAIYLQTENVVLDEPYVKPHDVEAGRYVKISVTDTGVGMDERTRLRIFEPFYTTKDMGKGAGLGLASAYGIIKGHKGIINCYSEKGHGTTFNIYLPATLGRVVKGLEETAVAAVDRKVSILLVDDEKTVTDVTSVMLEKLGHQVLVAHGGEESVEIYRMKHGEIDLVIMDMTMPEMSGGEAIAKIKSINPDARILLSSGYSINGMAREIMNRDGVQGFIQKPFRMDQLASKINEVMTDS